MSITKLFERLGFPLSNARWSWGARNADGVLLRVWTHDLSPDGRYVPVLAGRSAKRTRASPGLPERIDQLRILWSGGIAGYAVLATAVDPNAATKVIQSFDEEAVRAITSLIAGEDGAVIAELGEEVPIGKLRAHAKHHRLSPADGLFPDRPSKTKKIPNAGSSYVAKLPAMREWLIEVARSGRTVTYAEARQPFQIRPFEHRHAMDHLGHACLDAGEPILTSLIVGADGRCSPGFFKEFRRDDIAERRDCYAFWSDGTGEHHSNADLTGEGQDEGDDKTSLRIRASKFARVASRPEQAAFRRRVFLAYNGACWVTGCRIVEALDAAHRTGRDWRLGHNQAADGILLRKDIHALYDSGLVTFGDDGSCKFEAADIAAHYREFVPGLP
ncbi:HNH endonuclease [Variovorax sp. ZT5P49]|uniref:HNH endonuclease n=1 Tax=Variovorax sp. ZT5P49 TaxID=3443733 RepID=UPI003F47C8DF